jgi:prophage antirepressor-like protein
MIKMNMQVFENNQFGEIRIVEIDEKCYFVGSDVAKALGYQRPNDAVTRHCRGTVKRRIVCKTSTYVDNDGCSKPERDNFTSTRNSVVKPRYLGQKRKA